MKGKKMIKRVLPIMLAVMVGLTFSFEITKADASALSKPGQVKSLTVKHDTTYPDAAVLKWKKVSNATGYKVYRSTKKTKGFKCLATIKGKSNTKFTDYSYDLSCNGKTWYYKVRAYKKKGSKTKYGKYSKVKSFKNPLIDVGFYPLGYGYNEEDDEYYFMVEASNFNDNDICMASWLNANDDYDDYDVVAYWDGDTWVTTSDIEDYVVDAYTATDFLCIIDGDAEYPFLDEDYDWFYWYFMTEKEYTYGCDVFYGDWYQYDTTIYFAPTDNKSVATKKNGAKNFKFDKYKISKKAALSDEMIEKYNALMEK